MAPLSFNLKKSMPGFSVDRKPMEAISAPYRTARRDCPIVAGRGSIPNTLHFFAKPSGHADRGIEDIDHYGFSSKR
jgi:hypothetical protein